VKTLCPSKKNETQKIPFSIGEKNIPKLIIMTDPAIDRQSSFQGCQMVYFQARNPDLGKF
jgi:hypothetical protein